MLLPILILSLLILSYILNRSTDILIFGINQLARGTKMESYGVTTFLVALATSLPELFVGITSALNNEQTLALGIVVGSNIANVSLVIASVAIVSGVIKAQDKAFHKDVTYIFLIASMPHILLFDKTLSRLDGLLLLAVYLGFVFTTMTKKKRQTLTQIDRQYFQDQDLTHKIMRLVGKKDMKQGFWRLVIGSAALIVSADLIVLVAGSVATLLNVSLMIIGLFVISVGASLPDIAFSLKSSHRGQYVMIFANLFGAVVVKSTLVLGLVALINPIILDSTPTIYFSSVIAFIVVYAAFWIFSSSKKEINRLEGFLLLGLYGAFVAFEMLIL